MQHKTKTTQEILEAGGKGQNNAHRVYSSTLEQLRDNVELNADERADRANNAHDAASRIAAEAIRQRNEMLEAREGYLERRLFGAPDHNYYISPEAKAMASQSFTDALSRATLADDAQLESLHNMAKKTGSTSMQKAVFAVAHERGRGDLTHDYLRRNGEALGFYEELLQIPDAEARQRALDDAPRTIPEPRLAEVQPSAEARQRAKLARPRPLMG